MFSICTSTNQRGGGLIHGSLTRATLPKHQQMCILRKDLTKSHHQGVQPNSLLLKEVPAAADINTTHHNNHSGQATNPSGVARPHIIHTNLINLFPFYTTPACHQIKLQL